MSDRLSQCPHQTSLRSFVDLDPYDAYDAAARITAVAWDESFGGWVVLRYAECAHLLKEADTFPMPWNLLDGGHLALGKYGIFNLTGTPHGIMHKYLLDYFNPRKNKELQPLVRERSPKSLDRVADPGLRRVPDLPSFVWYAVVGRYCAGCRHGHAT